MKALLLVLMCMSAMANEVNMQECRNQGNEYMNRNGKIHINSSCENITRSIASVSNNFGSKHNTIEGHGHGNLIYITTRNYEETPAIVKKHIISGVQSELQEIHSIKPDLENRILVVLANEDKSIYNFRMDQGGNVGATRTLRAKELSTATNILPISERSELAVLHQNENKITFYKRFADIRGRAEEFKTDIQYEIYGGYTELNKPVDMAYKDNSLYVYNQGSHSLTVYDLYKSGDIMPFQVWDFSNLSEELIKRIQIEDDKIILFNVKGKSFEYSLNPLEN